MTIAGIEAYEKNANFVEPLDLYNTIFVEPALEFFRFQKSLWNVVVCTHVLEHHTKEDGWFLLEEMYAAANKAVVLASPYGEYKFEGNPNPYQDHKSTWFPDEIAEKYPITTPIMGRNNTGHLEFLIVIPK